MKTSYHPGRRGLFDPIPPELNLGFVLVCQCCEEICAPKWQDIGVYDRREMAWRSDCCGARMEETGDPVGE